MLYISGLRYIYSYWIELLSWQRWMKKRLSNDGLIKACYKHISDSISIMKDMRTKSEVKSGKLMKQLSSDVINYHCNYLYFLLCPHLPTSFTCKRDILFTPCLPWYLSRSSILSSLLSHEQERRVGHFSPKRFTFNFKPRGASNCSNFLFCSKINLIST